MGGCTRLAVVVGVKQALTADQREVRIERSEGGGRRAKNDKKKEDREGRNK